jgi:hypothetical protein
LQLEFDTNPCQAAKDVSAAQEALIDIFERIKNFFKRLETYMEVPPTTAMTDIIVKIMVEVLNVFAIATKEIRQGRTSKLPESRCSNMPAFMSALLIVDQRNT